MDLLLPHISSSNLALLAIIFTLLFFIYALLILFRGRHTRLPPQPGGAWPVIGHLPLLTGKELIHNTLGKLADAYGPIFMLRLGSNKTLIVSGWEVAKECFTTNDKSFASRPKFAAAELLGYNYAMFGTSPYGSHWRHVRKIVMLELLTNHRLEKLQHILRSEVQSSIERLHELCRSNKRALVEMETWFGDITLNSIFRMVVGKRFSTAFEESGREKYHNAMKDFFNLFTVFVPSDLFPFLRWFDLGGYKKTMKKTAKVMDEMLDKWLREHREKRNSDGVGMEEQDFMHVMLSITEEEDFSGYDIDNVIKSTCLALILGGYHTTTTEMVWALSLLVNNEESLKKVQFELDEQVGREREVRESDMSNLIYLQAVVKETLRLYPAAQLLVPHESIEDCTVAGYHIRAGTRLWVNLYKLQRDPCVWESPREFRPERFLTSEKNFDVKGQSPQFIPFGAGRRICPGISFAMKVMHLSIARLLHEFEIERPFEEPVNMEEGVGLNISKKIPLEVVITPRVSPQIYK